MEDDNLREVMGELGQRFREILRKQTDDRKPMRYKTSEIVHMFTYVT